MCQAKSHGYFLKDSLTLVDTTYWLQMINWQTKFLTMVLNFTKDPGSKTLRPLIKLYGRDRDHMKVEVEILERQLKHRLTHFAEPDDATVRKVMSKNERRILAACQVPAVVPKAAASVCSSRRHAEAYSGPCLTHRFR